MTAIEGSLADTWLHQRSGFSIIHEDSHADTWTQMEGPILIKRASVSSRTIFIGTPRSFAIGGTARSPDLHRTAAVFRDRRHCAIARSSTDRRRLTEQCSAILVTRGTLGSIKSSSDGRRTWSHHDHLISIGRQAEEELDRAIATAQRT